MEYLSAKKEKKTFRDILLDHLSKILEISVEEFRGGYINKKIIGNVVEEVYVPDTRKKMIQSIEFFSYILQPRFDEKMKTRYEELMEKVKNNLEDYEDKKIDREIFVVNKLRLMIELFQQLNFLLQEIDFLKAESYEDMMDEDEA